LGDVVDDEDGGGGELGVVGGGGGGGGGGHRGLLRGAVVSTGRMIPQAAGRTKASAREAASPAAGHGGRCREGCGRLSAHLGPGAMSRRV
jgi:hypothetical protein